MALLLAGLLLSACCRFAVAAEVSTLELLHRVNFDWQRRVDRYALASDLFDRVADLAERVPPQDPAERERISLRQARLAEDNPQGLSRLFLSAAYQHWQLEQALKVVLDNLECVRREDVLVREIRCWHAVALTLLQEEHLRLALDTLRRSRRMPPRRDEPLLLKDPQLWFARFARGILVYIVDPYLETAADASP